MKNKLPSFFSYIETFRSKLGKKFYVVVFLATFASFLEAFGFMLLMPMMTSFMDGSKTVSIRILDVGINFSLPVLLVVIFLTFVIKGLILYKVLAYVANVRSYLLTEQRSGLIMGYLSMKFDYYLCQHSGELLNLVSEHAPRSLQAFHHLTQVIVQCTNVVIFVGLVLFLDWQLAFLAILVGSSVFLTLRRLVKKMRMLSQQGSDHGNQLAKKVSDVVTGYEYLAMTGQADKFSSVLMSEVNMVSKIYNRCWHISSLVQALREPLLTLVFVILMCYQYFIANGDFAGFFVVIALLYRGMSSLMAMQTQLQFAMEFSGSADKVSKKTKDLLEFQETLRFKEKLEFKRVISLEGIYFRYAESPLILNNLSITIPKNTSVAIVGPSGSGKSTLVKLLSGLVIPSDGSVMIDSYDLQDLPLGAWRSQLGYVPQNPQLFEGTIADNIQLGVSSCQGFDYKGIKDAATRAGIDDFISSLSAGYDSPVGERGITLSGGQKQRISIAREMYRNAHLLIFDEATSALDSESELVVQESIDSLKGSLTTVIIAHRLSTVMNCDSVYVLDGGVVVESGSPQELVNKVDGIFSQMVDQQGGYKWNL